jgi:hypothetical protein
MLVTMRIREFKKFPKRLIAKLTPIARDQFESSGELAWAIFDKSERKWIVYADNGEPLLVAGVLRMTLLGRPELWFMMCEEFALDLRAHLRDALALREELLTMYPVVRAKVNANDSCAKHFARFFSFRELSTECFRGRYVTVYEVAR